MPTDACSRKNKTPKWEPRMPVVYIIIIYVLNSVATLVETREILIEWQENVSISQLKDVRYGEMLKPKMWKYNRVGSSQSSIKNYVLIVSFYLHYCMS